VTPDAIVIGAGVNGLVTAQYLARAGRAVLVLERSAEADAGLDVGWVPPDVIGDLRLKRHGLEISRPDPWIVSAIPGARPLELFHDIERTVESIRRLSAPDAARWPDFCRRAQRLARVFERLYAGPPPDLHAAGPAERRRLARLGLGVRARGRESVIDLLRTPPMSVAQVLDQWFETAALKGALIGPAVAHLRLGPRSGGTAFSFLHHHVGCPPGVFRPAACNVGAVLARLPGVEVRRGAEVARVSIRDGRATGVVLATGEEIAAPLVASSADPRRTILTLVDADWLDPEFVRAVRNVRCRGVVARVTLGCTDHPGFEALTVAPSVDYVERAYDDAKYGRVSAQPAIEARRQDGVIVAHVQYAPHVLADGVWDDAKRRALGALTARTLSDHVPGLEGTVEVREVLAPPDLEARYGVTEGNLYHGEMTLDQILFMRPVPECSRYRTPIEGLYLCGAGTHPGGGILGGPGRNAARVILRGSPSN
jgi:phytoene dehydrogenase-like protein